MNDEIAPLQVVDSTAKEQGGAGMRDALLVIAALPALIAVFGKRDMLAAVTYIASDTFAPALGIILATAVVIWRQMLTRWQKRKLINVSVSAPDAVVTVISK